MNMLKKRFGVKWIYIINKKICFIKKIFIFSFLLLSQLNNHIFAAQKFKTKDEADKYLYSYCVDLISFTKEVVNKQEELAEEEKWREFIEHGSLVQGASQIYANFCKKWLIYFNIY